MNERIKELARQSTGASTIYMLEEEWLKFAELIVRECAGVGYDASYYECALNVSNKIREHYGVEE